MITAVVSNGCSFVWGQELKNRDDRFVKIISNYFNANLHDVSMPGNCNQLICTDTIDKILNLIHNKKIPTEKIFVIINWSFLDRIGYYDHVSDSIYSVFGNLLKKEDPWILYSTKEKKIDLEKYNYIKRWYNDHGKLDYTKYSTFNYIYYLQSFLIANNIKYIFAFVDDTVDDLLKLKKDKIFKKENSKFKRTSIENILKIIDTNYFYLDLNICQYTKMGFNIAPKGHPLDDAHAIFAEELIAFIEEKYFEIGIRNSK